MRQGHRPVRVPPHARMHAVAYLDGKGGGSLDLRGGGVGRAVGSGHWHVGAVVAAHDWGGIGGGDCLELVCRVGAGEGLEELDEGVMLARRISQDESQLVDGACR